jgi:hypothetical protein
MLSLFGAGSAVAFRECEQPPEGNGDYQYAGCLQVCSATRRCQNGSSIKAKLPSHARRFGTDVLERVGEWASPAG